MSEGSSEKDAGRAALEERARTLVLLCKSLEKLGSGLDLAEVSRWLTEMDDDVQVEIVADLCGKPDAVSRAVDAGAVRVVLGLCSSDYEDLEMQFRARKAGLDPLGVETVDLGEYCALPHSRPLGTDKAKLLLAAAAARARAFPGSRAEHLRPQFETRRKVSRRALFTLPPIRYQPVVSIDRERCASDVGCRLCVDVCPEEALASIDGRISVDKGRCLACGLCVSECPRTAIELPTYSPQQVEAELTELLKSPALDPGEPRAVLFTCQRSAPALQALGRDGLSYQAGWLPLSVPCAGMVAPSWVLQSFALGAAAVGVIGCGSECRFGQGERVEARLAYCREILGALRGSPGDVRFVQPSSAAVLADALCRPFEGDVQRGDGGLERAALSGPLAAATGLKALAGSDGASPPLLLAHPQSPFGLVGIDPEKCTGCGACARACPTGALGFQEEDGAVSLSFGADLCSGCGQCVGWCPEEIVHVERVTDLQKVTGERLALYEDRQARCEVCGAVIAPRAMLRKVEELLGPKGEASAATVAVITRRCPSCRAFGVGGGRGAPTS